MPIGCHQQALNSMEAARWTALCNPNRRLCKVCSLESRTQNHRKPGFGTSTALWLVRGCFFVSFKMSENYDFWQTIFFCEIYLLFSMLVLYHHLSTFKVSKKLDRLVLTFIKRSHIIQKAVLKRRHILCWLESPSLSNGTNTLGVYEKH